MSDLSPVSFEVTGYVAATLFAETTEASARKAVNKAAASTGLTLSVAAISIHTATGEMRGYAVNVVAIGRPMAPDPDQVALVRTELARVSGLKWLAI